MTKREWIRTKARALWAKARPILPDLRDLHVYGGGLAALVGGQQLYPGAGFVLLGAVLVYLGLRR